MTDEQINQRIAEACGWKLQGSLEHRKSTEGWQFGHTFVIHPTGELVSRNSIPNCCNDLNAMHEAEKVLGEKRNHYIDILGTMYKDSWEFATATARQRAEAFLRTLGKWEEKK